MFLSSPVGSVRSSLGTEREAAPVWVPCLRKMLRSFAVATLICGLLRNYSHAQEVPTTVGGGPAVKVESWQQTEKKLVFEVASIKPSRKGETTDEQFFPDGYRTTQRVLSSLIIIAYFPYAYYSDDRLRNAPAWTNDFYDVVAKVAPEDIAEWQRQTRDKLDNKGLQSALQALLADRFKLVVRRVPAEVPGYDLVVGHCGVKLTSTPPGEVFPKDAEASPDGTRMAMVLKNDATEFSFYNASMKQFATYLSLISGAPAPIQDKTGLTGRYDFVLRSSLPLDASSDDIAPTSPSTRWNLGLLGLNLQRAKVPTTTLVIDHIERPSPD